MSQYARYPSLGGGGSGTWKTAVATTAQRNALTPIAGMMVFNTDTSKFQGYDGTI